jgi:hypothetical protein
MNSKSYYIYINSKNRFVNDEIYNFNVYLNNPIIVNNNQGINLSVVGFSMLKTDYNLKGISFKVDEVDIGTTTYTYTIPDGNYNYLSLMEYLNQILAGKIKVEYLKHRNVFKYTNLNYNNYDYYIRPMNAGKYLGLKSDLELTDFGGIQNISKEGSFINLTNYSHIIIKSNSILFEDNTQDNFNSREFGNSSILFMIDVQDIQPFQLISYRNYDNGDNYSYNISNRQLTTIDLQLYNEKGELLTNTDDYFLILKIVIFNKDKIDNSNNSNNILEDIKFLLMSMMFNSKSKNKNLM